jgi:hypothetical protein
MHPADAPPGSLRALLIKGMTSLEPVTKRLSSELVWALCEGDGGEEEVSNSIYYIIIQTLTLKHVYKQYT